MPSNNPICSPTDAIDARIAALLPGERSDDAALKRGCGGCTVQAGEGKIAIANYLCNGNYACSGSLPAVAKVKELAKPEFKVRVSPSTYGADGNAALAWLLTEPLAHYTRREQRSDSTVQPPQ